MPLSAPQAEIAQSARRFRVAVCGRRFGKTYLAQRELARFARHPGRRCWFVAPTRDQGKGIVWESLKQRLGDLRWIQRVHESELRITLVNGSTIMIRSADAYDRMRGYEVDFVVFDEFADMDPDVWTVVRPTLSTTQGHALFIGTPRGITNWSKDVFDRSLTDPDNWQSWQFTTLQGGRVSEEEIAAARRDLDERSFREEYEATFETYSGRVYYAFDRVNIAAWQPAADTRPPALHIGMDFNIDPMSACIAVREGDIMHVMDEIRMFSSNTQEMISEIQNRYPGRDITIYPDPASRQRKTSAGGVTDLSLLQNARFRVVCPHSHDAVRDGVNAVNSRFRTAAGTHLLKIDPKCKYTIESLERLVYKPGTTQPDKDSGHDHMTDALRYMITAIWPVRRVIEAQPAQRWTHRIQ